MLHRFRLLAALWVFVCPLATHAQSDSAGSPLAIRATVVEAIDQGPHVAGTLRLTIVNTAGADLAGLKLRLQSPGDGALGNDGVDIGNVEDRATKVVTAGFRVNRAFYESGQPLAVTATFRVDGDAAEKRATIRVTRDEGAR
jgi:hypothetical protein